MQAIDLVRIARKDLPVKALGLIEPTSLMQGSGAAEGFFDIDREGLVQRGTLFNDDRLALPDERILLKTCQIFA